MNLDYFFLLPFTIFALNFTIITSSYFPYILLLSIICEIKKEVGESRFKFEGDSK